MCFSCYNKNNSKKGKVYFGETTRNDGTKKIYTGQTRRSVFERVSEHLKAVKSPNSKTYTGRGTKFKLLGSIFSTNRFKAEKTIKKMSSQKKKSLAVIGAINYKKKR